MKPVVLFCLEGTCRSRAEALARREGIPLVDASHTAGMRQRARLEFYREQVGKDRFLAFQWDAEGLKLALVEGGRFLAIAADFCGPSVRYRRRQGGGRGELIARAVGLRGETLPQVLDATAGLGGDAFLLASLGCSVTLLERVSPIVALLEDAIHRARAVSATEDPELSGILARIRVLETDAIRYLAALTEPTRPDVVYLDPMFPERRKSAAVKKEMQVFHQLVGPDEDAAALLSAARQGARHRVVVKRPRLADPLAGEPPDHALTGVRNRFDLYQVGASPLG